MFSFSRFNPFSYFASWRCRKAGPKHTMSAGTSTNSEKPHNPFYDELFRLASERGSGYVPNPDEERIREDLSELVKDVPKTGSQPIVDAPMGAPPVLPPNPTFQRARRPGDGTTVDLKSWWGQSVATWDTTDGKNLDSVEKQNHLQKANRWTSNPNTKWKD